MLAIMLRCWVLCTDLGDVDFAVREAAQQQLADAGTLAVPALLWHQNNTDPEIRKRVAELLQPFASSVRLFRVDLVAVWIMYGPAFPDDDALLTWFQSRPAEVAAVIALADKRGVLRADWSRGYLQFPEFLPFRVPLWYKRLRWAAESGAQ